MMSFCESIPKYRWGVSEHVKETIRSKGHHWHHRKFGAKTRKTYKLRNSYHKIHAWICQTASHWQIQFQNVSQKLSSIKSHVHKTNDDANSEKKQVCMYGCWNGLYLNFIDIRKDYFKNTFLFRKCIRNCLILWIISMPFTSMASTTKLPSKFFFSSDHSWPGFPQVLSHVFLRRVEDEEVVGGAGERREVGGVQLQADQQDLPRRQEAGLLKPQGGPPFGEFWLFDWRDMKRTVGSWN